MKKETDMNNIYDTIVIGAGSVGNPSTYFLAKQGQKVLCIDKYAATGQGQNKAAIGGVRATHSDPAKIKICQQSLDIFANWKNEHGFDVGYKKGGYCFPVYNKREEDILKSILPIQKEHQLNINWVNADEVQNLVPGINPEGLIGGTYSPDDAQISPLLASEGFHREAERLGATYKFRETVVDFIKDGDRILGVKTDKDTYQAKNILLAAGENATELGKKINIDIPIAPDSHEAGITAPMKQFLQPLVVDIRPGADGKTSNFYFGQNNEGQIIFCYTPKPIIPGVNCDSTSEFMPVLAKRMVELVPRFKNLIIRRIWRGLYPMTPDGVAIVGKVPNIDGLYLAVGMCGQGFMMGPGVGINLASLIIEGKPKIDENIFALLKPDRDFAAAGTEKLK